MTTKVVVVAPILARNDAVSQSAIDMWRQIQSSPGYSAELLTAYSDFPEIGARVVNGPQWALCDPAFLSADAIIYHFGVYAPIHDAMLIGNGQAKQIVMFHNVTPSHFLSPEQEPTIVKSFRQMSNFFSLDAIWCASPVNAEAILEYGISGKLIEVIPLAVDTPSRSYFLEKDKKILEIVFVGRIVKSKGVLDLVHALELIYNAGGPEFRLRLAGNQNFSDHRYLAEVKLAAETLGERVEFLGAVDDFTRDRLLREAHILAIPSYHEGFCKPVIEGLRAGCIPVGYNAYNTPNVAGQLGRLVAPGDVSALSAALHDIASCLSEQQKSPVFDCELPLDRGPTSIRQFDELVSIHVRNFETDIITQEVLNKLDLICGDRDTLTNHLA